MFEPIEMPFGMLKSGSPRNHILDGVQIPHRRGNFEMNALTCPTTFLRELCKNGELINMPFGLWTWVRPRKHVLDMAQLQHAKGQLLGERTCPSTPGYILQMKTG